MAEATTTPRVGELNCLHCAANLIFGHLLADFHNIPASLSALTRFFLGDFNYEELSIARPRLAPIFFWMYNVVVIFVVINMFIAIITSYFEEVHRDAKVGLTVVACGWASHVLVFRFLTVGRRACRTSPMTSSSVAASLGATTLKTAAPCATWCAAVNGGGKRYVGPDLSFV